MPHTLYNVNISSNQYPITITSLELKASVDLTSLLEETAKALMNVSSHSYFGQANYKLVGKFGLDGSEAHKIHHQTINSDAVDLETPHHI